MRIGILGAARVTSAALLKPAEVVDGVEVAAVAARDRGRAEAFAARHGVPTVRDSYADLLADPSLDAVYIPVPNSLHAKWMLEALRAGKHILCEKPFTANAAQAREVAAAAEGTGLVVMEGFHYRYHPLAQRMAEVVHSGELGRIERVETANCFPLVPKSADIRYTFDLGGGALMDAGCYAVNCLRLLTPGEPTVRSAKALTLKRDRRVDRAMTAQFDLPGGGTGRMRTSLWSADVLRVQARVIGEHGTLAVANFAMPHLPSRFTVTVNGRRRREQFDREPTFVHQLRAFAAAVRGEPTNLTPPSDSVATMALIDDIYTAAGLPTRP